MQIAAVTLSHRDCEHRIGSSRMLHQSFGFLSSQGEKKLGVNRTWPITLVHCERNGKDIGSIASSI